jgi:hypothetical protein
VKPAAVGLVVVLLSALAVLVYVGSAACPPLGWAL